MSGLDLMVRKVGRKSTVTAKERVGSERYSRYDIPKVTEPGPKHKLSTITFFFIFFISY